MIVKIFDIGWNGTDLKSFEQEILEKFLGIYYTNRQRVVLINTTWYTDDFHKHVMHELSTLDWDLIILISMLDPPAPRSDIYPKPWTMGVGYYPGPGRIDFWALAVERYLAVPLIDDAVDIPFICLNRKPHWHRVKLYDGLDRAGLLDHGMVSLGGSTGQARRVLPDDHGGSDMAPNPGVEQNGIRNDIFSLGNPRNWSRCLVSIVTETVYDISGSNFVSEKIYKPMLGRRPFLVYAPDGARSWLETRGFQTYLDDWWDITDLDLSRPDNIVPFLSSLCQQPTSYLRKKLVDLQSKISYNENRFYAYCMEQKNIIERGLTCPV